MARLNSKLEAEGAEFLVLAQLLIEGIVAHKTYTRTPGYDLIAAAPDQNTSVRIQVKSRYATDFDGGFLISNFDCDFVVFVALNREYRYSKKGKEGGRKTPDFFVFPIDLARKALYEKSKWGKAFLNKIPDLASYQDAWHLISNRLSNDLSGEIR
jgi:hypothetical protein